MKFTLAAVVIALLIVIAGDWYRYDSVQRQQNLETLINRQQALSNEIQLLKDENAIENLQRAYGYYTDKKLWTQVADLFSENATVEYSQRGVVTGRQHIREFLQVFGEEGIQAGVLANHIQMQPVITVAEDGLSGKGRWRALQMNGVFHEYNNGQARAAWGGGIYENEYVKQEGVWKISKLHVYNTFYVNYDPGWGEQAYPHATDTAGFTPDSPPSEVYGIYPEVHVAPFHYPNPVTKRKYLKD